MPLSTKVLILKTAKWNDISFNLIGCLSPCPFYYVCSQTNIVSTEREKTVLSNLPTATTAVSSLVRETTTVNAHAIIVLSIDVLVRIACCIH